MPSEVVLTFNEEISEPAYVVVRTPDGTTYEDGLPVVDENTVTQAVVDSGSSGRHVIAYRVVSADGHPVVGEFEFTVADGGTEATPDAASTAAPDAGRQADASSEDSDESFLSQYGATVGVVVGALVLVALALGLRRRRTP
jgi:hypothetical protein